MDSDRAPWIIGGVAAAFFVCVMAVVCAAAFFLVAGYTGARSVVAMPPPTTPTPTPAFSPPAQSATLVDADENDDPALGPADAPVVIVMFSDFECPFCKRFHDTTQDRIMTDYEGQVRLVFRDFPLESIHPEAMNAALAAECADDQGKFWEMQDLLFDSQDQLGQQLYLSLAASLDLDQQEFEDCYFSRKHANEIERDLFDGATYGVTGTPTFFINGRTLVGAQPFGAFEGVIDDALQGP